VQDSFNHRNGKYTSAQSDRTRQYHVTSATRTVHPGEEIYISYNLCDDCGGRRDRGEYGTAEIFRDYGFVELFPQRWHYTRNYYSLDLHENDDDENDVDDDTYAYNVRWIKRPQKKERRQRFIVWLQTEIRRLRKLKNVQFNTNFTRLNVFEQDDVPLVEQNLIKDFVNANIFAMTMALQSLEAMNNNNETAGTKTVVDGDQYCASSPSSSIATNTYDTTAVDGVSHYDPLDIEPDVTERSQYTCDTTRAFNFVGYDEKEVTKTPYQDVSFIYNNQTNDMCLDLGKAL
jgi:hypothetical protein